MVNTASWSYKAYFLSCAFRFALPTHLSFWDAVDTSLLLFIVAKSYKPPPEED